MRSILPFILIIFTTISCSRTVYVPVLRPAQVHVGQHIQTITILDRSEAERSTLNIIESVITGEIPGLDKEAAQAALDGLSRSFNNSDRFRVVRASEQLKSPALPGQWPPILDWALVDYYCKKYNSDALLVLEAFDSNFIVTNGSRAVKEKDKDGNEISRNEFYAEGIATVNLGFRLYDVANRTIIDEHLYGQNRRWEATGNILQLALTGLIDQRQAVTQVANQSGRVYANRITPNWIRANRSFYTKGKGDINFEMGARRATVNDWNGAMEAWYRSSHSNNRKTAGRSFYNLALMHEIQGDLEKALNYAQRSYTDYRIKQGREYANILRRRIRDAARLEY